MSLEALELAVAAVDVALEEWEDLDEEFSVSPLELDDLVLEVEWVLYRSEGAGNLLRVRRARFAGVGVAELTAALRG